MSDLRPGRGRQRRDRGRGRGGPGGGGGFWERENEAEEERMAHSGCVSCTQGRPFAGVTLGSGT
eukprot:397995-Pyramimonas_sp.AAC.1